MAVRKKQVRELAEKILRDSNVTSKKIPVDIESITRSYGIHIIQDSVDDGLSGFLVRNTKEGKVVIGVNGTHHPNRRRFTIAHELGHYLLHEGELVHFDGARPGFTVNLRSSTPSAAESDIEREANLFAAEILMPASFLDQDDRIRNVDLLDEKQSFLKELAKEYQVSIQALTYRLANLGLIDP